MIDTYQHFVSITLQVKRSLVIFKLSWGIEKSDNFIKITIM